MQVVYLNDSLLDKNENMVYIMKGEGTTYMTKNDLPIDIAA